MPAIITHHLFGISLQPKLCKEEDAFATNDELSAFLLGNQGPDPLYFAFTTRCIVTDKKLGSAMHRRAVPCSLDTMRTFAASLSGDEHLIADAYLKGFICHYTLDSVMHPFVYAQQNAITAAGVKGLGPQDGSFVHAQIETDQDAALLMRMTGQTITTWRVHDHVLIASSEVLKVADKLYRYAAAGVYGTLIPKGEFGLCVRNYRITTSILHSPTGKMRSMVGVCERLVRRHSVAQALSHRVDVGEHSEWDNEEHATWANPFTGELSNESFDQIFARAQTLAVANIALHEAGNPSKDICGTTNFRGDPHADEVV